jgi:hypothetical protein
MGTLRIEKGHGVEAGEVFLYLEAHRLQEVFAVSAVATSPYIRSETPLEVWVVYVELDNPLLPRIENIHKTEYLTELKEMALRGFE